MPIVSRSLFFSSLLALTTAMPVLAEPQAGADSATAPSGSEDLQKKLEDQKKALDGLAGDVKKLKGLKVTGFIQARYEHNQSSVDGITRDGRTPAVKNQFSIRRGRVRVTWAGTPWSEATIHLDATGRGVSLLDAEVSLLSPWKPVEGRITLGQGKIPFGHEIGLSTSNLELPERSVVVNRFFPGVRDRGLKIQGGVAFVRFAAAVLNGNGIQDTSTTYQYVTDKNGDGTISEDETAEKTSSALNFGNVDRDHKKDFVGRVGVDFGFVSGGLNGYFGQWGVVPTLVATTNPDTGETTYSGGDTLEYLDKTRLGVDVQLNLNLIKKLGNTALRAEYIQGHGLFDGTKQDDVDARGWYVTFVQNLGSKFAVAARADQFDPNLEKEDDTTFTIEPALLFLPTQAIKVTAAYRIISDFETTDDSGAKVDRPNNQFTLQFQGKF